MSTITDRDVRTAVEHTLAEHTTDHDVDAIVREIVATYGLVDIETIEGSQYWDIVQRHAKP